MTTLDSEADQTQLCLQHNNILLNEYIDETKKPLMFFMLSEDSLVGPSCIVDETCRYCAKLLCLWLIVMFALLRSEDGKRSYIRGPLSGLLEHSCM